MLREITAAAISTERGLVESNGKCSIADHMRSESVVDAREMAGWRDRPGPGAIVHSDRGGQGTQTWADVRGVGGRCDRSSVQLRACVLAPP
jgi:hypothetical protein